MTDIHVDKDTFRRIMGDDHEDWLVEDEGDWDQDSKYQHIDMIVKHVPTGKYYRGSFSRAGSPFTDWDYQYYDTTLYEVERVEKVITTTSWEPVKQ